MRSRKDGEDAPLQQIHQNRLSPRGAPDEQVRPGADHDLLHPPGKPPGDQRVPLGISETRRPGDHGVAILVRVQQAIKDPVVMNVENDRNISIEPGAAIDQGADMLRRIIGRLGLPRIDVDDTLGVHSRIAPARPVLRGLARGDLLRAGPQLHYTRSSVYG